MTMMDDEGVDDDFRKFPTTEGRVSCDFFGCHAALFWHRSVVVDDTFFFEGGSIVSIRVLFVCGLRRMQFVVPFFSAVAARCPAMPVRERRFFRPAASSCDGD